MKLGRPAGVYDVLMKADTCKVRPMSRVHRPVEPVPPIREQTGFHVGDTMGETKKAWRSGYGVVNPNF